MSHAKIFTQHNQQSTTSDSISKIKYILIMDDLLHTRVQEIIIVLKIYSNGWPTIIWDYR
jgi:hypothetical protein